MRGPDPQALREIPVEVLREWYRDRVEVTSIRDVAELADVGRSTLHKFVREGGSNPHPRIRRRLALYYVVHREDDDAALVRAARAAFEKAATFFPDDDRERAFATMVGFAERLYVEANQAVPTWVQVLSER